MADPIEHVLSGTFPILETGSTFLCPIKSLVIETTLSGREAELLGGLGLSQAVTLVCDQNSFDVLGQRTRKALPSSRTVVLKTPAADEATVAHLIDQTRHAETLVAIGSGTINDLCKYASHERGRPYAVFATAPSMNGYTTATASISRHGEKLSLPAAPPVGAFFDLDILAQAPPRMIRAGVGDSLCRSTAQVDWLLNHRLLGGHYMATPFAIQRRDEASLLAKIGGLDSGDLDAMRALVRLLVLGGLGMLIAGNSHPGSQGEHLISHYIDMFQRPHPGTLHGEQVGLAAWTMACLQHDMLARDRPPPLRPTRIDPSAMMKRYGRLGDSCRRALEGKSLRGDRLEAMKALLEQRWTEIRRDLIAIAMPLDALGAAFATAGVAIKPDMLGMSTVDYRDAVRYARDLRDRFTMLDLAGDAGLLNAFITKHLEK